MDEYFGIGKLNFFLFLIVYFMIVGVVAAIIDPAGQGLVTQLSDVEQGADKFPVDVDKTGAGESPNPLGDKPDVSVWDAIGKVGAILGTCLSIFWTGLTFNVPGIPFILRLFLVVPVTVLFVVIILDYIIDILKAVFKIPFAG